MGSSDSKSASDNGGNKINRINGRSRKVHPLSVTRLDRMTTVAPTGCIPVFKSRSFSELTVIGTLAEDKTSEDSQLTNEYGSEDENRPGSITSDIVTSGMSIITPVITSTMPIITSTTTLITPVADSVKPVTPVISSAPIFAPAFAPESVTTFDAIPGIVSTLLPSIKEENIKDIEEDEHKEEHKDKHKDEYKENKDDKKTHRRVRSIRSADFDGGMELERQMEKIYNDHLEIHNRLNKIYEVDSKNVEFKFPPLWVGERPTTLEYIKNNVKEIIMHSITSDYNITKNTNVKNDTFYVLLLNNGDYVLLLWKITRICSRNDMFIINNVCVYFASSLENVISSLSMEDSLMVNQTGIVCNFKRREILH